MVIYIKTISQEPKINLEISKELAAFFAKLALEQSIKDTLSNVIKQGILNKAKKS